MVDGIALTMLAFVRRPLACAATCGHWARALAFLGKDVADCSPRRNVPSEPLPGAVQRQRYYLSIGAIAPCPGGWVLGSDATLNARFSGGRAVVLGNVYVSRAPWPFGGMPSTADIAAAVSTAASARMDAECGDTDPYLTVGRDWTVVVSDHATPSMRRCLVAAPTPLPVFTSAHASVRGTLQSLAPAAFVVHAVRQVGPCWVAVAVRRWQTSDSVANARLVGVHGNGDPVTLPGWTGGLHELVLPDLVPCVHPVTPTCAVVVGVGQRRSVDRRATPARRIVHAVVSWTATGGLCVTARAPPRTPRPAAAWPVVPLDACPSIPVCTVRVHPTAFVTA